MGASWPSSYHLYTEACWKSCDYDDDIEDFDDDGDDDDDDDDDGDDADDDDGQVEGARGGAGWASLQNGHWKEVQGYSR